MPSTNSASVASSLLSKAASNKNISIVNKVVREINLRNSKQSNIVISGLPSADVSDSVLVQNLLMDEMNISVTVSHIARLGKHVTTRPQLQLATLPSADNVKKVFRLAKSLPDSTAISVRENVYINQDLTQEQRNQQYKLRTELKHRKASGERNLVIKNGVITNTAPEKRATTTPSAGATTSVKIP